MSTRPTVQRRRLRAELRRAREAAGRTRDQVADAMDWSVSKLVRIEAGTVGISTNDLKALLRHYQINDEQQVENLLELAKVSRQRMWWANLKHSVPTPLLTYIGFEAEATRISHYHTTFIPGLLQTEEFMRALMTGLSIKEPDPDQLDSWVRVRRERQRMVFDRPEPVGVYALIDEAAVRRQIGGPRLMAIQLRHLIELAYRDAVTVQILPFTTGAHPGMARTFAILEFDEPEDDIVYLDGGPEDVIIQDQPGAVTDYKETMDRLRALALPEAESIALMAEIADEMS